MGAALRAAKPDARRRARGGVRTPRPGIAPAGIAGGQDVVRGRAACRIMLLRGASMASVSGAAFCGDGPRRGPHPGAAVCTGLRSRARGSGSPPGWGM